MTIYKKKKQKHKIAKKVVGVFLPLPTVDLLTLYNLSEEQSNSTYLEHLIVSNFEKIKINKSTLERKLAVMAFTGWVLHTNCTYPELKERVRQELSTKLTEETISNILNYLDEKNAEAKNKNIISSNKKPFNKKN